MTEPTTIFIRAVGRTAAVRGSFLPSPSSYSLHPCFITPLVSAFRSPPSGFRFQVSAFQPFSVLLRGQSSNVRWVCCWREVISSRQRRKSDQTVGRRFFTSDRASLWSDPFTTLTLCQ